MEAEAVFPSVTTAAEALPERARSYLDQALESLHVPSGAVMLAASAVDAMLKAKGYKDGTLYARIDKAAADHVITDDMAQWAHLVRLDANDERHADESTPLPDSERARLCVELATAFGDFMFVLPDRVAKGLKGSGGRPT